MSTIATIAEWRTPVYNSDSGTFTTLSLIYSVNHFPKFVQQRRAIATPS
jgi:hypothetical protein